MQWSTTSCGGWWQDDTLILRILFWLLGTPSSVQTGVSDSSSPFQTHESQLHGWYSSRCRQLYCVQCLSVCTHRGYWGCAHTSLGYIPVSSLPEDPQHQTIPPLPVLLVVSRESLCQTASWHTWNTVVSSSRWLAPCSWGPSSLHGTEGSVRWTAVVSVRAHPPFLLGGASRHSSSSTIHAKPEEKAYACARRIILAVHIISY